MKKKLLWCMTALTALLSASCTSELALEGASSPNNVLTGEEVEVTFSISAGKTQAFTRGEGDDEATEADHTPIIGKAQNIDMLIYAVYEKTSSGEFNLLKQYGKGIVEENGTFETNAAAVGQKVTDGMDGQTVLCVGDVFKTYGTQDITLRLMRGKEYHIAFWAQSSKTAAFNTSDLTEVTVDYNAAQNNDELRDAFCKVESFSVNAGSPERTVILTRPMAQINVGTTGADYKHLLLGENVFPNRVMTKSKIELTGVASTINVVTDEIKGVLDTPVKFDWSPLAAYIKNDGKIPEANKMMPPMLEEGETVDAEPQYDYSNVLKCDGEEFLRVDLDNDGKILRYKTSYPTIRENGTFLTETFKYLSMCYALVPAQRVEQGTTPEEGEEGDDADNVPESVDEGQGDATDNKEYPIEEAYSSSTLSEVKIYFGNSKAGNEGETEYENPAIQIVNVPVHRNWRTNILGGLAWTKDSTDPNDPGYPDPEDPDDPSDDPDNPDDPEDPGDPEDGPDDPTSVFNFVDVMIKLDNTYDGEYNSFDKDDNFQNGSNKWDEVEK